MKSTKVSANQGPLTCIASPECHKSAIKHYCAWILETQHWWRSQHQFRIGSLCCDAASLEQLPVYFPSHWQRGFSVRGGVAELGRGKHIKGRTEPSPMGEGRQQMLLLNPTPSSTSRSPQRASLVLHPLNSWVSSEKYHCRLWGLTWLTHFFPYPEDSHSYSGPTKYNGGHFGATVLHSLGLNYP